GKEALYSVLRDSDLLISFGSTADVEGLMLDKDVLLIDGFFGDFYQKDPYRKAVIQAAIESDLTGIIDKILNESKIKKSLKQKRERYLKGAFFKIDGRVHERVANLICTLIKKK
ncbi:MAG: hypothetical protein QXN01_04790, partial [Candidatus Anstonellales archaeon]